MKRVLSVLALLLLPLILFSQGKDLVGVNPAGAIINFWFQHTGVNQTAMFKMIDEFNLTNQWDIQVKGDFAGPYDQIYNKMIASIAAKSPPELVVAYQNQSATYAVSDALVDMNLYVKDPLWGLGKDIGDFFEGFINQDVNAQFGGKRLGFPPNRSMEVLYYNATMLKALGIAEPPKTWDAFEIACEKATNKEKDTYGYTLDPYDASHIFSFVVSRGGEIARADGQGYTFNTPQMKAVMASMQKLNKNGWGRKTANADGYYAEFGNGKSLFTMVSTSRIPNIDKAVKAGKGGPFDWSVAAIPQTSATATPALDLYGASVSIPKTTPQKQLAAWLFIKWFSEPKQQATWANVTKYFPIRKSAEPLISEFLASDARFASAWNLLKTATLKTEPPYAGYDLVRDQMNKAYSDILNGADIDKTLATLEIVANKLFKDTAP